MPRHPPGALSFLTGNIVCYLVFIGSLHFLKLLLKMLGGDKEIRTLDPLRARQVLSQLSYIPMFHIVVLIICSFLEPN